MSILYIWVYIVYLEVAKRANLESFYPKGKKKL